MKEYVFKIKQGVLTGFKFISKPGDEINIVIPEEVTEIAAGLFKSFKEKHKKYVWIKTRVTITLPSGLKKIGKEAFAKEHVNIIFPNATSLTEIGPHAFEECKFEQDNLQINASSIGECAFQNCTFSQSNLRITTSRIGKSAFQLCRGLKKVILCGQNASIGEDAFAGVALHHGNEHFQLEIQGSVESIGARAFMAMDYNRYGVIAGGQEPSDSFKLVIPQGLKSIGEKVFDHFPIEGIALPHGLVSIGAGAFQGCPLKRLTLPDSVETVGESAFQGCPLESLDLSKNLKTIGNNAFGAGKIYEWREGETKTYHHYESVTREKVVGSHQVTTVNYGLAGRPTFTTQTVNDTRTVKERVPAGYVTRRKPSGYHEVSSHCNVAHIEIPDGTISIGKLAFSECKEAVSLSIPNSVQKIGDGAFSDCNRLQDITIPARFKGVLNSGLKKIFPYSKADGSAYIKELAKLITFI